MSEPILHIATSDNWERCKASGMYRVDSLELEGFIHCSTASQVIRVANSRFRGQSGLVLLVIDPSRIAAEIRYENLEGGEERFPHIYGPVPIDAILDAQAFEPEESGDFRLPSQLREPGF